MTKLKTLKDFVLCVYEKRDRTLGNLPEHKTFWVDYEEIKKEAIKWVKHFQDNPILKACGSSEMMKEFFNITEEDLK